MAIAVSQFNGFGLANTAFSDLIPSTEKKSIPKPIKTFDNLRQINAGVLNIGFAEAGPANGRVVILLHGWPYDIHSFTDVVPILSSKGYRIIIPHLRGYGTTTFL